MRCVKLVSNGNQIDGITNVYHTPYLVDLINQGSKIIPDFEIQVPERFIAPERREHLYVPGSPTCRVSLVGKCASGCLLDSTIKNVETLHVVFRSSHYFILEN